MFKQLFTGQSGRPRNGIEVGFNDTTKISVFLCRIVERCDQL